MIDHIAISVTDYDRAKAFYAKALAPLGYTLIMEPIPGAAGFGKGMKPDLWIGATPPSYWTGDHRPGGAPIHIAIAAESRAEVDAFYEAAIAAGAKDLGAPGPRPHYHPNYYGAFVVDPEGNNLEAVHHGF